MTAGSASGGFGVPVPSRVYDKREGLMKRFLLGTSVLIGVTALAAPALAADPIKLELRGYAQFGIAGIADEPEYFGNDRDGIDAILFPGASDAFFGRSVVFGSDSEIHFLGTTTLDSGLAISFRAELELEDDPEVDLDADIIDEVYVQVQGGFGRIQLGMQDGVADQMIVSAPNVFAQFTISSIDMNPFEMYRDEAFNAPDLAADPLAPFPFDLSPFPPSRTRQVIGASGEAAFLDTAPDFTDDFTKIIYITPRVFGLQIGGSYTPNPCRNDRGLNIAIDTVFGCGRSDKFGAHFWEVAGNFSKEFDGGYGVGVSGSYGRGKQNSLDPALGDRPSEWHLGGEFFVDLASGRLTIGGAYKDTDNIDAQNFGAVWAGSQHWDAGAKYSIGPWEVGGAYGKAESVGAFTSVGEELTMVIGGVSYKLGPGIKLGVGVVHGDAATDAFDLDETPIPSDEAKGTSVFTELDLRF